MAPVKDEDFDPSTVNASTYVMGHIGLKGLQAGSLLGLVVAVPIAAFRHSRGGGGLDASFMPRAEKALQNTALWTTALSLLSGVGLLGFKEGWDKEKLEDRAYRLHYNSLQNRTDQFSQYGAAAGAIAAVLLGNRSLSGIASGFLVGTAVGTLAHVASSPRDTESQVETAKSSVKKVASELNR